MNRLQMSFSAPAPVWKARSSWARATIAMETTEQKICWPWEDKKERCFRKKKQPPAEARDKEGYYDGYFCGVRETDADSRNLPSKVGSVQIPSPKPAICNVMRCLAGLIRPLALCLLIPPGQWQRSDVTGGDES
ncbi:hypothetical protein Q7C36_020354 [Tachysurus vachellii]|uniref:Uncharacterized protein n=1 Tax=Tachysurus vachellii TaxID=175792 RepID=A0AA88LTH4_TACVA|nr:hypothetical protein Q7C36_020354 [Tachysurus vachellii]